MRHRLFLALPFPESSFPKIQDLRSKIPQTLNWEPLEKLHLTLNFLGNVTDEQLPNLQKVISKSLHSKSSFKIHFGFVSTIYRRHEGSYLCLTPDQKSEELTVLQDDLKTAVYNFNIPVADRYWPHITIAKIPKSDPVTTKSLIDKIDALDLKVRFTLTADLVSLYESKDDRTGTHYSKIITYPLSIARPA